MAIRIEDKRQIVAEVNEAAKGALSAVLADYRGVTVSELTELRKVARENNVYLRVVRNTLLKRAVEGTDYECLSEALVGPTILAFSQEDPGAAARVLKDFSKENDDLYEIFARSRWQVGVYSTALYEGLYFGVASFILNTSGSEKMERLINLGHARLISSAKDIDLNWKINKRDLNKIFSKPSKKKIEQVISLIK